MGIRRDREGSAPVSGKAYATREALVEPSRSGSSPGAFPLPVPSIIRTKVRARHEPRERIAEDESSHAIVGSCCWLIALLAAACGDDTTGTTATSVPGSSTTGGATAVKNPGVFVHALDGEPTEGIDPAAIKPDGNGIRVVIQVYEFLVNTGPDGPELIPELATEVPSLENGGISADGLTYTFHIRQGVKFHDGTDLTAEDVDYSWDRALTMDLPESYTEVLTDIIADTRVVDDYTFEVTLQYPAAWFLTSVVTAAPAAVVSKDAVEAHGGVVEGQPNEWMTDPRGGHRPLHADVLGPQRAAHLHAVPGLLGRAGQAGCPMGGGALGDPRSAWACPPATTT